MVLNLTPLWILLIIVAIVFIHYHYDTSFKPSQKKKVKFNNKIDFISPQKIDIDSILSSEPPAPTQSYGQPLVDANIKKAYYAKLQENYKNYEKSIGEFVKYQTDDSLIIKTDTYIDPFKPESRSNNYKGKAIKDIYDNMVAGPKAKPRKIKKITTNEVVYEDESELNGGRLRGCVVRSYDNMPNAYQQATFSHDF